MKGKKTYLFAALFALLLMLCLVPTQSVKAASNPSKKTLKTDKTYSSYDITGDQKADKIKIQTTSDKYGNITKVKVQVNGKSCYTYKTSYAIGVDAELYTLKNGKPYLHLCVFEDDGLSDRDVLLKYKSGKLKSALNIRKVTSKFGVPNTDTKITVSGNKLKIRFGFNSYTTSASTFTYTYKYKSGSLKRTSNKTKTFTLNFKKQGKTFTTAKKLTVYSSPTKTKTKTLAKGTKVKITQIYQKGSNLFMKYKATKTGKTGWIKCYKKWHSQDQDIFKNLYWAG